MERSPTPPPSRPFDELSTRASPATPGGALFFVRHRTEDREAEATEGEAPAMCAHCWWINKICFWGHRQQARWKRPALFVVSLLGAALTCMTVLSYMLGAQDYFGMFAMLVLGMLSSLGLIIAVRGCDECVTRLMGNI
jgi:hypothetical protein